MKPVYHHVMLDKGIISVDQQLKLQSMFRQLTEHQNYQIDLAHLAYHAEYIAMDK